MQCARCHGVMSPPQRMGRRLRPKGGSSIALSKTIRDRAAVEWAERLAALEAETPTAPKSFFATYSRALALCALTFTVSAAVLYFLSFSVLHAGAVALPFLGLFAVGLLLSLALPFKMYREHRRFSA